MEQFDLDQLYQVIQDQDTVLKKFNENVNDKLNTILLIGDTGSGKSFVFNWVGGAEFQFEDNVLKLKQSEDKKFSAQSNAMQSVTYIPNFNRIDDHLIIDFPGFKDTKGKYSQLSIKLMFDEIVTKTNVKIVVVIPQPTTQLEERGAHIQELIKSAFTSQNTKFDSIGLIINSFQDPDYQIKDEEIFINKIREQLSLKAEQDKEYAHVYLALSKQIIIIEDIYDKNFETALSDNARKLVISKLKTISAVSYKPDYQDDNQVVGSYITQELRKSITSYQRLLQKQKEDAKSNQLQKCLDDLKSQIKLMKDISKDDCNAQTEWIKNVISKLELSKDKKKSTEKFLSIFNYFFKYKESISGYQNFEISKKQLKKSIKQYIIELEEEQKRKKEQQEAEQKRSAEMQAKHEREQEKLKLQIQEQNDRYERGLQSQKLKESESIQKQQAEQLKILKNSLDEKKKTDEKDQSSQIQHLQSIKEEKEKAEKAKLEMEKVQNEKEKKKKDLLSKLHGAEVEQKKLMKQLEDYLEKCKKGWKNPSDYNTKVKEYKDCIQAQEDIIENSKGQLIYDN